MSVANCAGSSSLKRRWLPAAAALHPERPARHVRVGGEQVGQKDTPQRTGQELTQRLDLEDGHALPAAHPFRHVGDLFKDGSRARQQHREGEEGGDDHERVLLGRAEEGFEYLGPRKEVVDAFGLEAQAGGERGGVAAALAARLREHGQVSVRETLEEEQLIHHDKDSSRLACAPPGVVVRGLLRSCVPRARRRQTISESA